MKLNKLLLLVTIGLFSIAYAAETDKRITTQEIVQAQKIWGDAIVEIGEVYLAKGDYKKLAGKVVDTLYGYDEGVVLFKPTRAAEYQFRNTEEDARSYFVGTILSEDHGFAIETWSKVRFENQAIIIDSDSAAVMGNYYFTSRETGVESKVEFTFGYFKGKNGQLFINIHHSSAPFIPSKKH